MKKETKTRLPLAPKPAPHPRKNHIKTTQNTPRLVRHPHSCTAKNAPKRKPANYRKKQRFLQFCAFADRNAVSLAKTDCKGGQNGHVDRTKVSGDILRCCIKSKKLCATTKALCHNQSSVPQPKLCATPQSSVSQTKLCATNKALCHTKTGKSALCQRSHVDRTK